ncbi:MAG: DUF853 family protein [Acidobacteria bacterium]|nr:DUF853 family protein [Acidobacteriota bacterium]
MTERSGLRIGERLGEDGARNGEPVVLDPGDLCTHGVIVGMTGSGKTGLAVALIEETLAAGVPVLAIDPKGDLTNLLLTFPGLAPEDFAPWVPEGSDPAATATQWRDGLAEWDLGPDQIAALRAAVPMGVYTPGSTAATPLNIVGTLTAPGGPEGSDPESLAAEIQAVTSGLLGLVGITGDPLASPEHLLVTNLIHAAWAAGEPLDLPTLVARVQTPPMRTLGVMELDTVIPPKQRTALAVSLNGLLATPGFQTWSTGAPLDVAQLLRAPDGRPRLSVVCLSHLSDPERQLAVSRILGALIRWFRSQPGTDQLRALVYLDEVAGYVPPTAEPATKQPILTILKQARAFGVGMVLATQNPVDLDYKSMSNAGTWLVGRLQTERDKARLLEGMSSAAGTVDVGELDRSITELAKRQFFLHQAKGGGPRRFTSRWAMSYLRGPVTGPQLASLPGRDEVAAIAVAPVAVAPVTQAAPAAPEAPAAPGVDAPPGVDPPPGVDAPPGSAVDGETTVTPPNAADGVPVRWIDPGAPWLAEVGGTPTSAVHQAGIAVRVQLNFDDTRSDTHHAVEWEAVLTPLSDLTDAAAAVAVDHDERDLRTEAPAGARYLPCTARIDTKTFFTQLSGQLKDALVRDQVLRVQHNARLKLWGRPGESDEEFAARCDAAAQTAADAEAEKIRARLAQRIDRLRSAVDTAEQRAEGARQAASDAKGTELTGLGGTLLGGLLGGGSRTRGLASAARKAMSGRERINKAQQRSEAAAAAVDAKVDDLAAAEAELAEALVAIDDEWRDVAAQVEVAEIRLKKTNVSVQMFSLVWIPV